MKYKVGDKVKIKSLEWYYSNSDCMGNIRCGYWYFTNLQTSYCGKVLTISAICDDFYMMKDIGHHWTDEMIEGLADEENPDIMISLEEACDWLWDEIYPRIDDDRIRDILMDDSYRANLVDAFKTAMIKKYNK